MLFWFGPLNRPGHLGFYADGDLHISTIWETVALDAPTPPPPATAILFFPLIDQ